MIITKAQALAIALVLALVGVAAAARGDVGEFRQAQTVSARSGLVHYSAAGQHLSGALDRL